jgi:hypothetical protein
MSLGWLKRDFEPICSEEGDWHNGAYDGATMINLDTGGIRIRYKCKKCYSITYMDIHVNKSVLMSFPRAKKCLVIKNKKVLDI